MTAPQENLHVSAFGVPVCLPNSMRTRTSPRCAPTSIHVLTGVRRQSYFRRATRAEGATEVIILHSAVEIHYEIDCNLL